MASPPTSPLLSLDVRRPRSRGACPFFSDPQAGRPDTPPIVPRHGFKASALAFYFSSFPPGYLSTRASFLPVQTTTVHPGHCLQVPHSWLAPERASPSNPIFFSPANTRRVDCGLGAYVEQFGDSLLPAPSERACCGAISFGFFFRLQVAREMAPDRAKGVPAERARLLCPPILFFPVL